MVQVRKTQSVDQDLDEASKHDDKDEKNNVEERNVGPTKPTISGLPEEDRLKQPKKKRKKKKNKKSDEKVMDVDCLTQEC